MLVNRYVMKGNPVKRAILKVVPKSIKEKRSIKKYTDAFNKDHSVDLQDVQIETFNRCNGECSFCPVNKHVDPRKPVMMEEALFDKILSDLKAMNYTGKVALDSNNEPLLDQRIYDFARRLREALPNAYLYIYTNGTLIDVEKTVELAKYLDEIVIDNYNDDLVLNENIKPIQELCEKDERLNKIVQIHLRKQHEVLYTRGGQAPNNEKQKERNYPCFLPYRELVIRPTGQISLCCSDALGLMTLGDVNIESIEQIWNSDLYKEIRRKLKEEPNALNLCKYCDSKHFS